MPHRLSSAQHGASVLEAVIAAGLLTIVLTALLPLVVSSAMARAAGRADTLAAQLARQRLAQLQALTHVAAPTGIVIDSDSRLDQGDPFTSGGDGLTPTGLAPLQNTTETWADWLDDHGAWLAAGTARPPGARFARRWGVLAAGPDGCLRLWVEVSPLDPPRGDRVAHAGAVQCPWGVAEP
jgi:hypothetical protein